MATRRFGSKVPAWKGSQGQGGMRAEFSGAIPLVRHSVNVTDSSYQLKTVADGKALAYPLVVYYGTTGGSEGNSSAPTTREGSRVNHVQISLAITQSDTSKPNQCYVGLISTSFSDAALNPTNMAANFNDLIAMVDDDSGTMSFSIASGLTPEDLTFTSWMQSAKKRHWIQGFGRNNYTLYSGRPALLKRVIRVPPKNRRQQFGSGLWLVIMNDSGEIQGEDSGDGTDVNVSLKTFFKEITQVDTTQT